MKKLLLLLVIPFLSFGQCLDFCYPNLGNGLSQSIIATEGQNIVGSEFPAFETNMEEGDVFGFFNAVNPTVNIYGYQCVGGIQGGLTGCGDEIFVSPLEYGSSSFVEGNLSFITWFADPSDPNLGVLSSSNPNFISNEVFAFVERGGAVYSADVEFFVINMSGHWFVLTTPLSLNI